MEDDVKQLLASQDDEFRSLQTEHHQYEDRLAILAHKSSLTPEEEIEEKILKKRKLLLKDKMAEKIRHFQLAHSA